MRTGLVFLAAVFAAFIVLPVSAQDQARSINGGVLNGKAISLPKPVYPAEAKAAGLLGVVRVKVLIDEEGNVISAQAEEAPDASEAVSPLLADSAVRAAYNAKFTPTFLRGAPVKVSGFIIYNFVGTSRAVAKEMAATAEENNAFNSKAIDGGVLNGKTTSMPAPPYPPAARAVRAAGDVTVRVIVDPSGKVIAAEAISGHPLLRPAAVSAARKATFSPMLVDGPSVNVSGVLIYNFAERVEKPEN